MPYEPGRVYSVLELCEIVETDLADRIKIGRWGRWRYDAACGALWFDRYGDGRDEENAYWVLLETAGRKHWADDWIWHLEEKSWVTDADLGAFVRAVLDLRSAGIIEFRQARG